MVERRLQVVERQTQVAERRSGPFRLNLTTVICNFSGFGDLRFGEKGGHPLFWLVLMCASQDLLGLGLGLAVLWPH